MTKVAHYNVCQGFSRLEDHAISSENKNGIMCPQNFHIKKYLHFHILSIHYVFNLIRKVCLEKVISINIKGLYVPQFYENNASSQ